MAFPGAGLLASIVIPKWLKWVAAALLLIGIVFLIGRCSKDDYQDDYRAQVDQTDRSTAAVADAAENAIETLEGRTATEDAIDQVVAGTIAEIDGAQDAAAVRAAVLAGVCQQREHRNDPACNTGAETRMVNPVTGE